MLFWNSSSRIINFTLTIFTKEEIVMPNNEKDKKSHKTLRNAKDLFLLIRVVLTYTKHKKDFEKY